MLTDIIKYDTTHSVCVSSSFQDTRNPLKFRIFSYNSFSKLSKRKKEINFNKFWNIEKLISKKKKKSKFIEIPINYRDMKEKQLHFGFRLISALVLPTVALDSTGLKVAGGALAVFAQAATVKKCFAADGAFLRSATVVPNVENEMRLFRVTGAALAAGERPALLQLVARRPRIPIAETLLVTPQMTGKGETLAAVFAIVFSFRVVPTYRVPREKLCNIINDRYQLCIIIVLPFIKLVSLSVNSNNKSASRFLIKKIANLENFFLFDGFHCQNDSYRTKCNDREKERKRERCVDMCACVFREKTENVC